MGAIARSAANNITTSGVFTSNAITNSSVTGITVLANASDGITLISSQTASSSASLSFTTGLDSTYKAYKFVFVNCHPATSNANFTFNMSTNSGSNYNVTKTTTFFEAYHFEDDSETGLPYQSTLDLSQSTNFQPLSENGVSNENDASLNGSLILFNPSSTTYVKHFISTTNNQKAAGSGLCTTIFVSGYGNTTSAINAVRFQFSSGNFDDGTIYLYGIK